MAGGAHPHEMANVEGLTEILNNHERRIRQLEQAPPAPPAPPEGPAEQAVGFGAEVTGGTQLASVQNATQFVEACQTEGQIVDPGPQLAFTQLGTIEVARDVTIRNFKLTNTQLRIRHDNVWLQDFQIDNRGLSGNVDNISVLGGEGFWFDHGALLYPGDEAIELWANSAQESPGGGTISYTRFGTGNYGLLIGAAQDNRWSKVEVTLYRNDFGSSYRQPLIKNGAYAHSFNNARHNYAWAAIEIAQDGELLSEGDIWKRQSSDDTRATRASGNGRIETLNEWVFGNTRPPESRDGVRRPDYPYEPVRPTNKLSAQRLFDQICTEAGPRW